MISTSELKSCQFLADLDESELSQLASIGTPSEWKEGETLFQARSPATHLYILKTGTLLLCFPNGRSFPIRSSGQAVGWSSLMSPFHYTATGIFLSDATVCQFPGRELYGLFQMNANLGYRIIEKISLISEQRKPYRQRQR
jgi:CRP-like cAMP-binding protein